MAPIIEHADVRRMLATMRSLTHADGGSATPPQRRSTARRMRGSEERNGCERAALLTPVAKAFATDVAVEVASLGIQVHCGWASSRRPAPPSTFAMPGFVDLRRHQWRPGDRPGDAQAVVSSGETMLSQIEAMRRIARRLAEADPRACRRRRGRSPAPLTASNGRRGFCSARSPTMPLRTRSRARPLICGCLRRRTAARCSG